MALAPEDREAIVGAITDGFKAASGPRTGQTSTGSGSSGGNTPTDFGAGFVKAASGVGKAMQSAGNDLNLLADGAANIMEKFPLVGDALGKTAQGVTAYLENTRGTFQALSKVGASLEGELGEFRKGAADTRLPLDTFANLIGRNSSELSALGGGVSNGVDAFRKLSAAMFEGPVAPINGFMALGMSIEESNEFIMDNMAMMRRQARLTGMTEQQSIAAAMNLAVQLDTVAKLTGKNAKEMQDEIKQRQRSGATQAALRLAEMRGATGAQSAYNAAQAELQKGPPALRNLVDDLVQTGVPMSKATQQFAALNSEAYALAKEAAAAAKRGDQKAAAELSAKAAEAANRSAVSERNLQISTLAQVSDIAQGQADTLEAVGEVVDAIAAHAKKMGISMETAAGSIAAFESLTKQLEQETNSQILQAKQSQTALAELNGLQIEVANSFTAGNKKLAGIVFDDPNAITKVAEKLREGLEKVNKGIEVAQGAANSSTMQQGSTVIKNATGAEGGRETNTDITTPKTRERFKVDGEMYTGGSVGAGKSYLMGERGPEIVTSSAGGSYVVGDRGPEIVNTSSPGTVLNNAQTNNAIASSNDQSNKGMDKLVEQLSALNDKTDALLRINTKQVNLGDRQVKAIKGAGNLMRGVG